MLTGFKPSTCCLLLAELSPALLTDHYGFEGLAGPSMQDAGATTQKNLHKAKLQMLLQLAETFRGHRAEHPIWWTKRARVELLQPVRR